MATSARLPTYCPSSALKVRSLTATRKVVKHARAKTTPALIHLTSRVMLTAAQLEPSKPMTVSHARLARLVNPARQALRVIAAATTSPPMELAPVQALRGKNLHHHHTWTRHRARTICSSSALDRHNVCSAQPARTAQEQAPHHVAPAPMSKQISVTPSARPLRQASTCQIVAQPHRSPMTHARQVNIS
jgi:hypothetical protein